MLNIHAKCDPRRDVCDQDKGLACSGDTYTCIYADSASFDEASSTDGVGNNSATGSTVHAGLYAAIAILLLIVVAAVAFAITWRRKSLQQQQQMPAYRTAAATIAHNPTYKGPSAIAGAATPRATLAVHETNAATGLYESTYEEMGPAVVAAVPGETSNNHYNAGVRFTGANVQQPASPIAMVQASATADATYEDVVDNLSTHYGPGNNGAADDDTYEDVDNNGANEDEC